MTFFHSVVDSPAQVKSWSADTWRSNTIAAAATEFHIDIDEPPGGPVVIRVAGNVDAGTVPVLSACLGESVLTGHSVVVDLLHVPFLGCPGLAALHRTATDLSAQRCRLTLAASADVRSILDRIGIGAAVPCFDTVANAFHAARSPRPPPAARIRYFRSLVHRTALTQSSPWVPVAPEGRALPDDSAVPMHCGYCPVGHPMDYPPPRPRQPSSRQPRVRTRCAATGAPNHQGRRWPRT
ncbi:STAS domain-containing protein [Rhodococcus opacus]|nr:STAS domain-containing protein [Rhodococcus opacus]